MMSRDADGSQLVVMVMVDDSFGVNDSWLNVETRWLNDRWMVGYAFTNASLGS